MRKKLSKLPEQRLLEIACNLGRLNKLFNTKEELINSIISCCKDYSFNYSDLAARYNLPN